MNTSTVINHNIDVNVLQWRLYELPSNTSVPALERTGGMGRLPASTEMMKDNVNYKNRFLKL